MTISSHRRRRALRKHRAFNPRHRLSQISRPKSQMPSDRSLCRVGAGGRQSLMNNDHPNYVGHFNVAPCPYLNEAIVETDLLIAIGPRLGEMTTQGYTLLQSPVPQQKLAHVFPDGDEIGRVFEPAVALVSDTESFCEAVAQWDPIKPDAFATRTAELRKSFENFTSPDAVPGDPLAGHFAHLADVLPADAIICNGAGNYAGWVHRFCRYRSVGSQLAPTSGSMGFGLPAAVGAAITAPEREVYAMAGDGCFMMTCQEMATAAHHNLSLNVIVVNNNRLGTIRAHQEREYPGRVSGTDLTNPDFCAFARSFGANAVKADTLDAFKTAIADARARKGLNLIIAAIAPTTRSPHFEEGAGGPQGLAISRADRERESTGSTPSGLDRRGLEQQWRPYSP